MVIEAKAIYLSAVLEVVASEISHNPHNQTTPLNRNHILLLLLVAHTLDDTQDNNHPLLAHIYHT